MNKRLIVIEMLLFFSAFFLSGYLAQWESGRARLAEFSTVALSYLISGIPQVLLMIFVVTVHGGSSPAEFGFGSYTVHDILRSLFAYLGIFAVLVPVAVAAFFLPDQVRGILESGYRWGLTSPSQLPLALAISLVAGYREEFFFRSYLLTRLGQVGLPSAAAVAVASLVFCLGHIYEGWAGLLVTAILGVYLSLIYLRVKNLHIVALAHGMYNFTVFCVSLLAAPLLPQPM